VQKAVYGRDSGAEKPSRSSAASPASRRTEPNPSTAYVDEIALVPFLRALAGRCVREACCVWYLVCVRAKRVRKVRKKAARTAVRRQGAAAPLYGRVRAPHVLLHGTAAYACWYCPSFPGGWLGPRRGPHRPAQNRARMVNEIIASRREQANVACRQAGGTVENRVLPCQIYPDEMHVPATRRSPRT